MSSTQLKSSCSVRPLLKKAQDLQEARYDSELFNMATSSTTRVGNYWSSTFTDPPSELTQQLKLTSDAPNSQAQRLDKAHQATKSMWSPSKKGVIERVKRKLEDCEFDGSDAHKRFETFPHDLSALKGRGQRKSVHHDSMLPRLQKDEALSSGDAMIISKSAFLIIVALSNQPNKSINSTLLIKLEDRESGSASEAMISVGHRVKSRRKRKVGGVEFDREAGVTASKERIERELERVTQLASTHARFAETAIKLLSNG